MSRHDAICPDGGTCHHSCMAACWRVANAGPLSGVFPDNRWPTPAADRAVVDSTSAAMLLIQTIAPDATVRLSAVTRKWYVEATIEVGGDGFLHSPCPHQSTPTAAVFAFLSAITTLDPGMFLVTYPPGRDRREWVYNGVGFAERRA